MAAWWIVFLAFDIILMGAFFYILAFRKNMSRPAPSSKIPAVKDHAPSILMELKEELVSVRKTAAALEEKRIELDAFDRGLRERYIKLDEMLKKAAESAKEIEAFRDARSSEDTYSRAIKMLRMGQPVEDVVKNLGILKGEAELISAINDYRQ
jgi:hypothetical protein